MKWKILVFTLMAILLAGCSPSVEKTPVSHVPDPPVTLQWDIVMDSNQLEKDWNSYEVLSYITEQTGVQPKLEFIKTPERQTLIKNLQTGRYPNLITCRLDDPISLQLQHSADVLDIAAIPEILSLLPEKLQSSHMQPDGRLWYVPGGFYSSPRELAPDEGIFVRKDLYAQLGNPALSTPADFIRQIQAYEKNLPNELFLPVVFGNNGDGLYTMEHLFGITPTDKKVPDDNKLPGKSIALCAFLQELQAIGITKSAVQVTTTSMNEILQKFALFYIGSTDVLNQTDMAGAYAPVTVNWDQAGYLQAQSPNGKYATYILRNSAAMDKTLQFVRYMLSQEGSRITMLGLQNKDWLLDADNSFVLFPDTIDAMQRHDNSVILKKGIGKVPFLSSLGASYPLKAASGIHVRDILTMKRQMLLLPTTEPGYKQQEYEQIIWQAYLQAIT